MADNPRDRRPSVGSSSAESSSAESSSAESGATQMTPVDGTSAAAATASTGQSAPLEASGSTEPAAQVQIPVKQARVEQPRMEARGVQDPGPGLPASVAGPTREEVVDRQRAAFGGIKWGSAFFGWLSAMGLAVILLALTTAAGIVIGLSAIDSPAQAANAATSAAANTATVGLTGGIILLGILALACYAGGYVAGRMARFDGARPGFAMWLTGVILTSALAVTGALAGAQNPGRNVFTNLNLPAVPMSAQQLTTAGLIALGAVLLGTFLSALAGGKAGEGYHRKIDRVGLTR